jgi:hypothetical protein
MVQRGAADVEDGGAALDDALAAVFAVAHVELRHQ